MDIQAILTPVLIVAVIGLLAGLMLSFASKFFAVQVDERVGAVREVLPGANCGSCGYAGCDDYAAKVVAGEAPGNLCTPGGPAVAGKIGGILGTEVGAVEEKKAQVLGSIEEQGKLTPELKAQILAAQTQVVVEDLYRPYRPKRRTRATIA